MGIKNAITAFFNKDNKTDESRIEYRYVYPCNNTKCVYCIRYKIPRVELSYSGVFPFAILPCILCEKLERQDFYTEAKVI